MDFCKLAAACAIAVFACGCISAPFQPPLGFVSVVKAPLSTEGNWELGEKQGEASATTILGITTTGDCSISAAARNGGLTKITHVDYGYLNIFFIYQRTTVIVHGE